jgi:hypothetical protein
MMFASLLSVGCGSEMKAKALHDGMPEADKYALPTKQEIKEKAGEVKVSLLDRFNELSGYGKAKALATSHSATKDQAQLEINYLGEKLKEIKECDEIVNDESYSYRI